MKEHAPMTHEDNPHAHEAPESSLNHSSKNHQKHTEKTPAPKAENTKDSIDKILKKIEHEAESSDSIRSEATQKESNSDSHSHLPVNSSLKKHARNQTLRKVQRKLPASQRSFSKVIHQPAVEQLSDVAGATIARPSGVLAGGFFSLVISVLALGICRYYGYEYNFSIGLMAFAGGFVLGLFIELLLRARRLRKNR